MANNIIDSIKLSGTVYTLSAQTEGGGVPESAFTAYTAATDSRIAEDEEVTAAGLNVLNESISGKVETTAFTAYSASVETALGGKQATLVSGTNIKTINNESILGSGNVTIQSGNETVELTQAQYDALVTAGTVSADTYYIITDATPVDMSQYWTSAQTDSAISEATSGKVDTTTYTAYTASTNTTLQNKQNTLVSGSNIKTINNESILGSGNITIQGGVSESAFTAYTASTNSRIAEDEEVTAAGLNALNDKFGGLKLLQITQNDYNNLQTKDPSTLYIIVN